MMHSCAPACVLIRMSGHEYLVLECHDMTVSAIRLRLCMHQSFQIIFNFNRKRLIRSNEVKGHNTWVEISLMHVCACVPMHNAIWVLQPLITFIVIPCLCALLVNRIQGLRVDNDSHLVPSINRPSNPKLGFF